MSATTALLQAGFRVCGFIHDEMLIELPEGADYDAAVAAVQQILADSMRELTPSIPIATEFLLADRWYKDAPEQPRDTAGRILPYCRPQPKPVCSSVTTYDTNDPAQRQPEQAAALEPAPAAIDPQRSSSPPQPSAVDSAPRSNVRPKPTATKYFVGFRTTGFRATPPSVATAFFHCIERPATGAILM